MENYKYLVLTDLDGTLLNSESLLSRKTIEIVHKLNKRGDILFSFSTGRAWEDCKHIYEILQLKGFVSCCNSALIYNPHTNYSHVSLISPHIWMPILKNTEILEGLVKGKILSQTICVDFTVKNASKVHDLLLKENAAVYGIKMYFNYPTSTPEIEQSILKKIILLKNFSSIPSVSIFHYPGLLNIEIQAHYVNKEKAVDFLGNYYNIEPHNILTFGDNHNDLAAMSGKSRSWAVKNAIDLIKQAAKHISQLTNNEDSVAIEIENFLLEQDKKPQ